MKWFGNLKTATKIISAFLIVSIILASLGVYSVVTLRSTNERMQEMYNNNLISVRNCPQLRLIIRDCELTCEI